MRHSGRPAINSGFVLAIGQLLRDGMIAPRCASRGTILFGSRGASVSYVARLERDMGSLHLLYTAYGQPKTVAVALTTTDQPFGGLRWWFVCPVTGKRVCKLYSPAGYSGFASRCAFGTSYLTQRMSPRDRMYRRVYGLREAIGGQGGVGTPIAKPKWMRWRTYDQRMAVIRRAESQTLTALVAGLSRVETMVGRG